MVSPALNFLDEAPTLASVFHALSGEVPSFASLPDTASI